MKSKRVTWEWFERWFNAGWSYECQKYCTLDEDEDYCDPDRCPILDELPDCDCEDDDV